MLQLLLRPPSARQSLINSFTWREPNVFMISHHTTFPLLSVIKERVDPTWRTHRRRRRVDGLSHCDALKIPQTLFIMRLSVHPWSLITQRRIKRNVYMSKAVTRNLLGGGCFPIPSLSFLSSLSPLFPFASSNPVRGSGSPATNSF